MKYAIQKIWKQIKDFLKYRVYRPFRKYRNTRRYLARRAVVREATGELVEKFEYLIMQMFDESVADYFYTIEQKSHYTIKATHDMRRHFEIKVKSFIKSQK